MRNWKSLRPSAQATWERRFDRWQGTIEQRVPEDSKAIEKMSPAKYRRNTLILREHGILYWEQPYFVYGRLGGPTMKAYLKMRKEVYHSFFRGKSGREVLFAFNDYQKAIKNKYRSGEYIYGGRQSPTLWLGDFRNKKRDKFDRDNLPGEKFPVTPDKKEMKGLPKTNILGAPRNWRVVKQGQLTTTHLSQQAEQQKAAFESIRKSRGGK